MTKLKYRLPDQFIKKASLLEEFANGATQITVRLRDGRELRNVLLSDSIFIIAIRGFKDLPFLINEIDNIFQVDDDKHPHQRSGWYYWDDWK